MEDGEMGSAEYSRRSHIPREGRLKDKYQHHRHQNPAQQLPQTVAEK